MKQELYPYELDYVHGRYAPSEDSSKYIVLRELVPLISKKKTLKLHFVDVDHKNVEDTQEARDIANSLDAQKPAIVLKVGKNKYQLLSNEHHLFKLKFWGVSSHEFYVFTPNEIEPYFRSSETGLKLTESRIKLKEVHDVFGFSVPVFTYLNHEEHKDKIQSEFKKYIDEKTVGESYSRTIRNKNIIDIDSEAILDIKEATLSAYDCFYRHVMDVKWADNIVICQSWMVDSPPWDGKLKNTGPMSNHNHFMSMACSTYYLKHETGKGGQLRLFNPTNDFIDNILELKVLTLQEPQSGYNDCYDVDVDESDIIIFPGALKHTIAPYTNKETNRLSVPTNSTITPLRSYKNMGGRYHYGYRFDIKGHHEL